MRQFGFVFPVGPEACPPLHFLNSVSDHAMMWIVCESRKDSTFTEGEIMLDVLHTDVPRIDEAPSVSLFDIIEQFGRINIAAGGDQ